MKIVRLHPRNNQLPSVKDADLGDVVVMSQGDIFCHLGDRWKLLGGRYLLDNKREVFLSYVKNGWPDINSMRWDLEPEFDMANFEPDSTLEKGSIKTNAKWTGDFLRAILETCECINAQSEV
jgi:hypothetical protein